MSKILTPYSAPLIQSLSASLPYSIGAKNGLIGAGPDEKVVELAVQDMIRDLLVPHLPNNQHIILNKKLDRDEDLEKYIPDIIIKNVGDGYWGVIELKTLFLDDSLSVAEVDKDLDKLCFYKKKYPTAAAIFALAGSSKKLFNPQREAAWEKSRIKYKKSATTTLKLRPQKLGKHFVAIPCGSSAEGMDVRVYFWEVLPVSTSSYVLTSHFRFDACMA